MKEETFKKPHNKSTMAEMCRILSTQAHNIFCLYLPQQITRVLKG